MRRNRVLLEENIMKEKYISFRALAKSSACRSSENSESMALYMFTKAHSSIYKCIYLIYKETHWILQRTTQTSPSWRAMRMLRYAQVMLTGLIIEWSTIHNTILHTARANIELIWYTDMSLTWMSGGVCIV